MTRSQSRPDPAARQPRPRGRIHDEAHGAYRVSQKLPGPTRCVVCESTYLEGRWTWTQAPADAGETTCSACRRIADGYPAGTIQVQGSFIQDHREELINLARNVEEREKAEHAHKRIMTVVDDEAGTRIDTTCAKLAQTIGKAFLSAYGGSLEVKDADPGAVVRVRWERS